MNESPITKHLYFISDEVYIISFNVTEEFATDFEDDGIEINYSLSSLKDILLSVLALHYIYKSLSTCSKTAILSTRFLPFMHSLLGDMFFFQHHNGKPQDQGDREKMLHDQCLNDILKSWNFSKHRGW